MGSAGEWLEKELLDLCNKIETGLSLDAEVISGLVSYCELASPPDAADYLDNIIGREVGETVIDEYMKRRTHSYSVDPKVDNPPPKLHAYVKPPSKDWSNGTKKPSRSKKEEGESHNLVNRVKQNINEHRNLQKENISASKRNKHGKSVSLADAAQGSIVYNKGKPCSCQARQHRLISNCLSCGKIVCEQEGEGPCSFCSALVLREGSTYASLDENMMPLSDAEAAAEAYTKRLVDYDRNSASRTVVIDDQSDYYNMEGNSWISMQEKELIQKKQKEVEEAEQARRKKVMVTFDLFGRKVLMGEGEATGLELHPNVVLQQNNREMRIVPNPIVKVQPVFVRHHSNRESSIAMGSNKYSTSGVCLEISGRVQHDSHEIG